jgi:hypothetical protein
MYQEPTKEPGASTAKEVKKAVEKPAKDDSPRYGSTLGGEIERNPMLDHPDPKVRIRTLDSTRAIVSRGLADGVKAIPQIIEQLNSADPALRKKTAETLSAIGEQLLKREGAATQAGQKDRLHAARFDILSTLGRLALDEKAPKELRTLAQTAARQITTVEERKTFESLDKKLADSMFGESAKPQLPPAK